MSNHELIARLHALRSRGMDPTPVIRAFQEASSEELGSVLEQAPIGIVVLRGSDLVYEYVNPAFQAFAPTVPLLGRRFADASWELPGVLAQLQEVWATGCPWRVMDLPVLVERAAGSPLEHATFSLSCVRIARRQPPDALLGFVLETTELVNALGRANAALQESRSRSAELEAIIETTLEGVIVFDRDRRVRLRNSAARRLLATLTSLDASDLEATESILGQVEGTWPDGRGMDPEVIPVARALAGETCRSTVRFANPTTRRNVYASIGAAPIRDRDGTVIGAVTVGSDVTEATELDRLKDDFIRQIAHELKTPITIMKGNASVLAADLGSSLSPPHARMLEAINRGADRINRIMCELLDAQQIELGRFELTRERVDLFELLKDVTDRVAAASPNHRIRFTASRQIIVVADAERLREVMRILLDNAVRYSPAGGGIDVALDEAGDDVEITVRDHGVGIAVERQQRIFQRFYRAHAGTPYDYGGTGLGLYVARTIVELHGGTIRFESAEGRGTTFAFRLPWKSGHAGVA